MEKIEDIVNAINSKEKEHTTNLIFRYLKRWPWFILSCMIGLILGYFIYKNSPNMYQIKSRILIINEESSMSNILPFDNPISNWAKNSNIENKIGILRSYTLYRKALDRLDWDYSWYLQKTLYLADLYNNEPFKLVVPANAINTEGVLIEIVAISNDEYKIKAEGKTTQNGYTQLIDVEQNMKFGNPFVNEFFNFTLNRQNAAIGETYILTFNNLNAMTSRYLAKTQIEMEEANSDIISVMIIGEVKQKEADFINELNKVFIDFGMENRYQSSEKSVEFIESQLTRIKKSLDNAEQNFSSYRKNNQVMNLGQEAQRVYERLEDLEQEQYLTQLQIDYYKDLQEYLDDSKKISEMVNPSVIGITDQNLNSLLARLTELYSRREVLSYSVQEKNPTFIMLEKEIKIARDGLEETVNNQLKATEAKKESMQERYNTIQTRLRKLPETERNLIGIQREFDLNNELYTYMLERKAEASISKASIAPEVQVIDAAMVEAAKRTGPILFFNLGLGLIGGGIIPFLVISLLMFFNNKIETIEEVEHASSIPVLEGIVKHKYKVKLPVIHHPRSGLAESFRGLKSNLNAILDMPGSKVISINSLVPGEGKSFISSSLSAIIAKSNNKVLLIGADLHKPTLHSYLDIKKSEGLSSYLRNEISIEKIISTTSIPKLHFIQAGNIPDNPSDLLDSEKFKELIAHVRKLYDYIIIDNAPILLVPDAILSGNFSDVSLFVLRINYSHKKQIRQISKIVDFNRIKKSAIVLNNTPNRGHGYGYGYGNKYWKNGYGEYKQKLNIV